MFTRSLLTTIIGFLIGFILYLTVEPLTTFIFLFGGLGYVIGLILDNADRKKQLETFHFSSIPTTHEIFHSDEIPEAVFIYSIHDNTTSVLLDYRIEAKPENYRLSVFKNLQEFDFRIIEDTSQTFFSLNVQYPEFNYPAIKEIPLQRTKFIYDIKERSDDFQGALQKLIPGIVISVIQNPDIFGNKTTDNNNFISLPPDSFFPTSPSDNTEGKLFKEVDESILSSTQGEFGGHIDSIRSKTETSDEYKTEDHTTNTDVIDEDEIIKDLNQSFPINQVLKDVLSDHSESNDNGTLIQTNDDEDLAEINNKSKNPLFITAKQIEENQNQILTHEETESPQDEPKTLSRELETDEKFSQNILDYSNVDSSASMPMDAEGKGIFEKILNSLEEREAQKSRKQEKISTEDS